MRTALFVLLTLAVSLTFVGSMAAQTVVVDTDISNSQLWTNNNVYDLQAVVYVLPGATLTIEAGTIISASGGVGNGGTLAVANGGQIFIQGTEEAPVIFTSDADRATWIGNDPKTGTWRPSANEWGNLTIMGDAYISENATVGNVASPNAANVATMEGLTSGPNLYGGGNDDDDSGSINYCSLRYAGQVVALTNELNGLSLGGLGRETDINYIEIMNNVDDGIEIWGGTVEIKHFSIWNVGDDSFDVDQGWRGKAQFGLIVQGYSLVGPNQGSGLGDNCFETDGAEDSDWQPVTTAAIYNCTVVGEPNDGDQGTAWRDNANVQYRQCIFTDIGDDVMYNDGNDGDGANGYGFNGTLTFNDRTSTLASVTSGVNAPVNPALFYTAQDVTGSLVEISDSVFHNVSGSLTGFNAGEPGAAAVSLNLLDPSLNNVSASMSPVRAVERNDLPIVNGQGKFMQRVTFLDPRPANDALMSVGTPPVDGFFDFADYRGAFAPDRNWLDGWTASWAYGMTRRATPVAGPGQAGDPALAALDVNGAYNANGNPVGTPGDLNGPHFATVSTDDMIDIRFIGPANTPVIFFTGGALNPNVGTVAGLGQIDVGVDVSPLPGVIDNVDLTIIANGNSPVAFFDFFSRIGPDGSGGFSVPAGLFPPGSRFPFQMVTVLSGAPFVGVSNAVEIVTE